MYTIVVGGQYGGEGKGKVTAYLTKAANYAVACRCGGPNSSHSIVTDKLYKLRMLPTAAVANKKVTVVFGAGTLIHPATLWREIEETGWQGRLLVDFKAGIVSEDCIAEQRADSRYGELGSTLTGTGYATARRSQRKLKLARELDEFKPHLADTAAFLYDTAHGDDAASVLIEGHQGYGLSNYHGDYPYCSSRDAIAAAMLSELGIGLRERIEVVMAVKVFPTRNHKGNLPGEMSVAEALALGITEEGGGAWDLPNRPRRVGRMDYELVARAARANGPVCIALTGVDYLCPELKGLRHVPAKLPPALAEVIAGLERAAGVPVKYLSTGPELEAMIAL